MDRRLETVFEPDARGLDARMAERQATGEQGAESVCRRAAIGDEAIPAIAILAGGPGLVPDGIVINEEKAAVVESGILLAHVLGEILAALDENERLSESRIVL